MLSFKTTEDKKSYDMCVSYYEEIIKGLGITSPFSLQHLKLSNDMSDLDVMNERLLLLTKISYYLSIIQGKSLELQREYKYAKLYGMYEKISETTRAVRMEADILRTILSTIREQIKMK